MSTEHFVLLACDPLQSPLRAAAGAQRQDIVHGPYGHRPALPGLPGSGFTGQWREAQTGWYLLGNGYRVYNPVLMRFHSPDSLSPFGRGGVNAYGYCLGDPVNRIDPDGHAPGFAFLRALFRRFARGSKKPKGAMRLKETPHSSFKKSPVLPSRPPEQRLAKRVSASASERSEDGDLIPLDEWYEDNGAANKSPPLSVVSTSAGQGHQSPSAEVQHLVIGEQIKGFSEPNEARLINLPQHVRKAIREGKVEELSRKPPPRP